MHGDRKILMWEYANNANMASFMLKNLGDHECLVLETNRRRQDLKVWRAGLLTPADFQSATCISHDELRRRASRVKLSGRQLSARSEEKCGSSYSTQYEGRANVTSFEEQSEHIVPSLHHETNGEGLE